MTKKVKNKLFSFFEKDFKVGLFYKPTMEDLDIFYYVILDSMVRLTIRMYDESNVITIHDIIPLTDMYLAKYYDKLIEFFLHQDKFTVLISKIGYTSGITETCMKNGIPLVDDSRFLSVPNRLYDRLKALYQKDVSKYGFYLLSVSEEPSMKETAEVPANIEESVETIIECEEITTEEIEKTSIDVVPVKQEEPTTILEDSLLTDSHIMNELILFLKKNKKITSIEFKEDTLYATLNRVTILFREDNQEIHIIDAYSDENVSNIFFMGFFEYIEKFLDKDKVIIVDSVVNRIVYSICKVREYEKLQVYNVSHKNTFGTYKMIKLIKK